MKKAYLDLYKSNPFGGIFKFDNEVILDKPVPEKVDPIVPDLTIDSSPAFTVEGLDEVKLEGDDGKYYKDAEGKIVGADGKTKLDKAAYDKIVAAGHTHDDADDVIPEGYKAVEIPDVDKTLFLNAAGELVEKDGTVFKTKAEVDSEYDINTPTNDLDVFAEAILETNIFEDGVTYEPTKEGVIKAISDAYDKGMVQQGSKSVDDLISQYPIINDVIRHITLHGNDFSTFKNHTDYNSIELTDSTPENVKDAIYKEYCALRGIAVDEEYIGYLKNANKYDAEVATWKGELVNSQIARQRAEDKLIDDNKRQARKDAEAMWGVTINEKNEVVPANVEGSVYDKVLVKGKLTLDGQTFTIPKVLKVNENGKVVERTNKDFFNWLVLEKEYEIDGNKVRQTGYQNYLRSEESKSTIDSELSRALKAFTGSNNTTLLKQSVSNHKREAIKLAPKRAKAANSGGKKELVIK